MTHRDKHFKRIICVDFDGVLNNYDGYFSTKGLGTLKEGADIFLKELNHNFSVIIFTPRNKWGVKYFLKEHGLDKYVMDVTNVKPPAFCYVDDRAVCFKGDFKDTLLEIADFKTYWQKRDDE